MAEMIASAVRASSAAPAPCAARPASSTPSPRARPETSEAPVNTAVPARNSSLRPYRSASRPPASSMLANTSTSALATHSSPPRDSRRSRWIDGSATFTTVLSSEVMNVARPTAASASRGLPRIDRDSMTSLM
jgi:hypothetical protein